MVAKIEFFCANCQRYKPIRVMREIPRFDPKAGKRRVCQNCYEHIQTRSGRDKHKAPPGKKYLKECDRYWRRREFQ